jgi:hypothetical protein
MAKVLHVQLQIGREKLEDVKVEYEKNRIIVPQKLRKRL